MGRVLLCTWLLEADVEAPAEPVVAGIEAGLVTGPMADVSGPDETGAELMVRMKELNATED